MSYAGTDYDDGWYRYKAETALAKALRERDEALTEVKQLQKKLDDIRVLLPRLGYDHLIGQFVNPAILRGILDGSQEDQAYWSAFIERRRMIQEEDRRA